MALKGKGRGVGDREAVEEDWLEGGLAPSKVETKPKRGRFFGLWRGELVHFFFWLFDS